MINVKFLRSELRYLGATYFPGLYEAYLRRRRSGGADGGLEWENWEKRIGEVVACPDNERLSRVPGAGQISGKWQTMRNGLLVATGGYYGPAVTRMLEQNRGCHEPQEELMFDAVLSKMPRGATMIECGAYWAFYSMSFCQAVADAHSYLIEPDHVNLRFGRMNFAKNSFVGNFTNAYVGEKPGRESDGTEIVAMDEFAAAHGLQTIDILHSDIQGAEVPMLHGAEELLRGKAIRFLFISTHSPELHLGCLDLLRQWDYQIVSSVDLAETYSQDGIIVAARPGEEIGDIPQPSKKEPA